MRLGGDEPAPAQAAPGPCLRVVPIPSKLSPLDQAVLGLCVVEVTESELVSTSEVASRGGVYMGMSLGLPNLGRGSDSVLSCSSLPSTAQVTPGLLTQHLGWAQRPRSLALGNKCTMLSPGGPDRRHKTSAGQHVGLMASTSRRSRTVPLSDLGEGGGLRGPFPSAPCPSKETG